MEWLLLSLIPGIENRGAIPLGILTGSHPLFVWIASSLLSFLAGFVVYLLLEHVEPLLRRTPLEALYSYFVDRVRRKGKKYIERYGKFALLFFVSVPLPGSGAYTGALFAYLFNLPLFDTATGLFLGTLVAGLIVLTASVSLGVLI